MKVPVNWLAEYCNAGLSVSELKDVLDLSGTEVERIEHVGIPGEGENHELFRIGRVVSAEQHPDADRLRVCQVDVGEGDSRTIVCGAPNVAAGQVVMVALPGAVLPDGTKLKRAKLRGVASDGMILSETEIGLGDDSDGIMVLPDSLPTGGVAADYVPLGEDVLELEITPNRPDCLAVYGVARELHAATGAALVPLGEDEVAAQGKGDVADYLSVEVADHELCPRFSVRVFTDVQVGASPAWLKQRLIAAGQRPISNVVDITNYVMLLVGQPMHAYDLAKIAAAKLTVRSASEGEQLVTLDGETRVFDGDAVLICDGNGPTGLAGIMGGAESEVSSDTTIVAMEAATWNGPNILKTSKKLGLRSEASNRFEKQLDPELALVAQRHVAHLMVELCGAKVVPGIVDEAATKTSPDPILLRSDRMRSLLGVGVEIAAATEILGRLGFETEARANDLLATPPYFRRNDVQREADVIEEIARIHGLDKLPATLPSRERAIGRLTSAQSLRRRAEDALRDRGFSEIVTYSFIAPTKIEALLLAQPDERLRRLHVGNPLSEDQSVMRTTLLPGVLDVAAYNVARDTTALRLFECGRVFLSNGVEQLPDERLHLAGLLAGDYLPRSWRSQAREPDFYAIKGELVALLEDLRVEWMLADGGPAFLHPGRAAQILAGGHEVGYVGELHPLVGRSFELDLSQGAVAVFELDLTKVLEVAGGLAQFEDLITFPAVYQDISVVVEEAVEAQTVVECVRAAGGQYLRSVSIFDLYRGDQIGEGKKSISLRLDFRSPERTLTDEDATARRLEIERELAKELGATLRV